MKNQNEIMQKLRHASCLLEYLENSLTVIFNTPECSCKHYLPEKIRKNLSDSIKLL